jgi:branched-chain amino acid transport system permease protein
MATGLTLVYGVMEVINFAQGILVVLGAYLSYDLSTKLHLDPFLSLLLTVPAMYLLGITIYQVMIKPIKRDRVTMSLLVMFAVALLIEGILDVYFSSNLVEIQTNYMNQSLFIGRLYFPVILLYSFGLSVFLLGALFWLLYRTKFGLSLRAAVQNPVAARIIGINTDRVSMHTLGIGVGLAAAGGMMFGITNSFDAASSYDLISRLLVIVILGGFGSVGGALVSAIVMVTIQDVVAVTWSPVWGQTVFYLMLIVVLMVRPQGFFGRRSVRAQ